MKKTRTRKKLGGIPDDPVIEEIREIRQRLWKQGGGTLAGYFRLMDKMAEERKARRAAIDNPSRRRKSA